MKTLMPEWPAEGHPEREPHDPDLEGEFFKLIGPYSDEILQAAAQPAVDQLPRYTLQLGVQAKYMKTLTQALQVGDLSVITDLLGEQLLPALEDLMIESPLLWDEGVDIEHYEGEG